MNEKYFFILLLFAAIIENSVQDCRVDQFQCGNGVECTTFHQVCDSVYDCSDGSDEVGCADYSKMFNNVKLDCIGDLRCGTTGCISTRIACGFVSENFEYEQPAHSSSRECIEGQFRCKDNSNCISNDWVCDGDNDCKDNSDEVGCGPKQLTPMCARGQFKCLDNSFCIDRSRVCDGKKDCKDESDELNCLSYTGSRPLTCGLYQHKCADNLYCIPEAWVCDGAIDCDDRSDEVDCEYKNPKFKAIKCVTTRQRSGDMRVLKCQNADDYVHEDDKNCTSYQFKCRGNSRCLPIQWLCDNNVDCDDGSDEKAKYCISTDKNKLDGCPAYQFECKSGNRCVPYKSLCNGAIDCDDGSDENNSVCKAAASLSLSAKTCTGIHFKCLTDSKCVPQYKMCDKEIDCEDGSDENNTICITSDDDKDVIDLENVATNDDCTGLKFGCLDNTACLPPSKVCDMNIDCSDGSDETEMSCFLNSYLLSAYTTQSGKCFNYEFECTSDSQCISFVRVCDGVEDCKDGSDENDSICNGLNEIQMTDYPFKTNCNDTEYQCPSGDKCLDMSRICDGVYDCDDGADENSRFCGRTEY